jgi:PAS domain S-box-containing protein
MEQTNRLRDERTDQIDLLTVLSGTTSFIFLVDRKLRIRFASPSAARYLGLTRDTIEGRRFHDLPLPQGAADAYESVIRRAFDNDAPQVAEGSYTLPGGRVYFAYDAALVQDGEGAAEVVLTAKEITASKHGEILGEVLNRVYAVINSTMSTPEIMKRLIEISSSVLDSEALVITMREGDRWVVRYVHESLPSNLIGASMTDEEAHRSILSPDEVPIAVEDVHQAAWLDLGVMARLRTMSFISVPFKVRSRVIGALVFSFPRPRHFSGEEIDFSVKLATAVSLALENSELYHQELEQRYLVHALLDDVPAVIMAVGGRDLRIKWANRYADRYKPEAFRNVPAIGISLESIIPRSTESGIAQLFKKVASSGRPFYASEFMVTGLRSDAIYWNGSVVPLRREGEEVPDLLIMAVDVTEQVNARKSAEDCSVKANEDRGRLQAILATLPVGVALIDRSGRIMEINTVGARLWATILPSFSDLKDLNDVQAWSFETGTPLRMDDWGMVKATFAGVTTDNEMVTLKRYDGREMVMMMSSTPLYDASTGVIGAVVVGQDLTNQLQVQRELLESKERAELFIDLLTHDINNLNAASMGYLQLLQGLDSLGPKEKGWAIGSLQALEESSRLIESIRGLQAIESGRETLAIIDLDQVLRKVVDDHIPHPSREIDIQITSRGNHCILASPLVQEVFSNLVDNAIKHSEGPLSIRINVSSVFETGKEYHRVDVEDDGPGIADKVKENVFARTWRGRTKGVGKGLGLFLVRRLVESLEGQVWVEDRVPGRSGMGARFVVLLPAMECRQRSDRDGN